MRGIVAAQGAVNAGKLFVLCDGADEGCRGHR